MEIKTLYTLHALLQGTSFLILFPIGIIIALIKSYIGPNWFILHIIFQSLGVFCIFTAITLMAYAQYLKTQKPNYKKPAKNTPLSSHVIIGITIVSLIVLQLIWAIFLRHVIDREIWKLIHIIFAILILTFGWINLYLGNKLYSII